MRISLVTPAGPGLRNGNRHTALRWAAFLRAAGHRVQVSTEDISDAADLMLALHARRSYPSIRNFSRKAGGGADRHGHLPRHPHFPEARASLEFADRLIVLQPKALDELPARFRRKARVVVQSAATRLRQRRRRRLSPLRHRPSARGEGSAAYARRARPCPRRTSSWCRSARFSDPRLKPDSDDPRYRWLGGLPHARALRWLASSHAMVISSRMEGGANVVCEALRIGVPVLASRISGNVGCSAPGYAGYFPLEDTRALAALITKAREKRAFYRTLEAANCAPAAAGRSTRVRRARCCHRCCNVGASISTTGWSANEQLLRIG